MMRFLYNFSFLLIIYLVFGFYLSQKDYSIYDLTLEKKHPDPYFDYKGVTNIHSSLSTGGSSPNSIVNSAKAAGLDFIIFTDLNLFEKIVSLESYSGNLLVMSAGEYNYLDSRLHVYRSKEDDFLSHNDAQIKITDYLSQKATEIKDKFIVMTNNPIGGYRWTGEYPPGLSGLEIMNPKTIAQQSWIKSKLSILWSLLFYPFNPRYSFLRIYNEPSDEITLWDSLNQKQKIVGFSGSDLTGKSFPIVKYKVDFPSYQRIFELMSNHVILKSELTGNYAKDREKIFAALKQGQFYFSFDLLSDPKGFISYVKDIDKNYLFGSEFKFSKKQSLVVSLPSKPKYFYEIVIYRNGERITSFNDWKIEWPIPSAGNYRVQVRVSPLFPIPDGYKWITWIYTNAFHIK